MKKIILFLSLVSAMILIGGCTDNQRARSLGGTMTVNLLPNQKLVNATWKEGDLWYLYRPLAAGEQPITTIFQEKSAFGAFEGKVEFVESKQ